MTEHQLPIAGAIEFILAGNSTFTLVSLKTQSRYTFKVQKATDKKIWFVKFLRGPNNEADFTYLGIITEARRFKLTRASRLNDFSPPVTAFAWFLQRLVSRVTPQNVELWHAGKCARCGRTLTTPASLKIGYGPECMSRLGVAA